MAEASGRFASAAMPAYLLARLMESGMNTARLARKWSESSGDYGRMAEALGEEIDDPAAGLVTRWTGISPSSRAGS